MHPWLMEQMVRDRIQELRDDAANSRRRRRLIGDTNGSKIGYAVVQPHSARHSAFSDEHRAWEPEGSLRPNRDRFNSRRCRHFIRMALGFVRKFGPVQFARLGRDVAQRA
jgi:hypothetical protein